MSTTDQFYELPDLVACTFNDLPGWQSEDFGNAAQAWQYSCHYLDQRYDNNHPSLIPFEAWRHVIDQVQYYDLKSPDQFRDYLQSHFNAYQVIDPDRPQGLFTGYFEPVLKGSFHQNAEFCYPVYGRPPELIVIEELGNFRANLRGHRIAGVVDKQTLRPFFTRQQIAQGALQNRGLELAWVSDPLDLFWMHIQGSGKIQMDGGGSLRLIYDGTNGYGYTAIGKTVQQQFNRPLTKVTMATLKQWLRHHPKHIDTVLWSNQSYVFFQTLNQQDDAPRGRIAQPLVPLRSIAVDPIYVPLGAPLWVDITGPASTPRLQQIMFAHDVGGAIKGRARGDVYWGSGDDAGYMAGEMQSIGIIYLLLPKSVDPNTLNKEYACQ